MPELFPPYHPPARRLFRDLERSHALVESLFEGCTSARLFVDEAAAPRTGVIVCNSRLLCVGDISQTGFLAACRQRRQDAAQCCPGFVITQHRRDMRFNLILSRLAVNLRRDAQFLRPLDVALLVRAGDNDHLERL